jgi:hypothetical protein
MCEILSVRVSVCPVQFVFTELQSGSNLLLGVHSKPKSCDSTCAKLRGVKAFSTTTKTVIKIMLILTPHAGFILTLSKDPVSRELGPLGAAPSSAGGGPQPFYALKCCLSMICRILRQSFADTTNLQFCLSPNLRPNRRHSILRTKFSCAVITIVVRRIFHIRSLRQMLDERDGAAR